MNQSSYQPRPSRNLPLPLPQWTVPQPPNRLPTPCVPQPIPPNPTNTITSRTDTTTTPSPPLPNPQSKPRPAIPSVTFYAKTPTAHLNRKADHLAYSPPRGRRGKRDYARRRPRNERYGRRCGGGRRGGRVAVSTSPSSPTNKQLPTNTANSAPP